jgi:carbon-monoxide dehydrogenase medium subunit
VLDVQLLRPVSLDEALSVLADRGEEATVLAGGTAVVLLLRQGLIAPSVLVSLDRLAELGHIEQGPGALLRLGARVTLRQAETSALVRARQPTLAGALEKVANVRVRHAATVGGNLAEADYASDPPGILVALRARVRARRAKGERELPVHELLTGYYQTTLAPDELLTEVVVPVLPARSGSSYTRLVAGSAEDRPCAGVTAVVALDEGGRCAELRVAVSAVGPAPVELGEAEAMASGEVWSDELAADVAARYAREIDPISDLRGSAWYRKRVVEVLVRRAVREAFAQAQAEMPGAATRGGAP